MELAVLASWPESLRKQIRARCECGEIVGVEAINMGTPWAKLGLKRHSPKKGPVFMGSCIHSSKSPLKLVGIPCPVCRSKAQGGNVPMKGPAFEALLCCKHERTSRVRRLLELVE